MRPDTWTATDPCACCLYAYTHADTCRPDCGGAMGNATGFVLADHNTIHAIAAMPASLPLVVRDVAILRMLDPEDLTGNDSALRAAVYVD